MAQFITRVELHDAITQADYSNLHGAMAKAGFTRTIKSNQGKSYNLPTAEYNYIGDKTIEQVFALAQSAAASTGRRHGILVTQALSISWDGLPPVA